LLKLRRASLSGYVRLNQDRVARQRICPAMELCTPNDRISNTQKKRWSFLQRLLLEYAFGTNPERHYFFAGEP
jgi:hypothetical protein